MSDFLQLIVYSSNFFFRQLLAIEDKRLKNRLQKRQLCFIHSFHAGRLLVLHSQERKFAPSLTCHPHLLSRLGATCFPLLVCSATAFSFLRSTKASCSVWHWRLYMKPGSGRRHTFVIISRLALMSEDGPAHRQLPTDAKLSPSFRPFY